MVIIGKVSKGSKMDQIYIPKNRIGLEVGSFVFISPMNREKGIREREDKRLFFFNVRNIEPIKIEIINKVISIIEENVEDDNIIITGSFLDKGLYFNDIDIIIVSNKEYNKQKIENELDKRISIKMDVIIIDNKSLIEGLESDPLYQMMLSKCIAKKRFIYGAKIKVNYRVLDLHLLKSKALIENYDILSGREKYNYVRNMIAIRLFLHNKKIDRENVEKEIKNIFNLKDINEIKFNILVKGRFLKKYKEIYNRVFSDIMKGIKNGAK